MSAADLWCSGKPDQPGSLPRGILGIVVPGWQARIPVSHGSPAALEERANLAGFQQM